MRKLKYNHPITSYPQDMREDSAGILRLCKSCILVWKPFVVCADTHTQRNPKHEFQATWLCGAGVMKLCCLVVRSSQKLGEKLACSPCAGNDLLCISDWDQVVTLLSVQALSCQVVRVSRQLLRGRCLAARRGGLQNRGLPDLFFVWCELTRFRRIKCAKFSAGEFVF